LPSRQAALAWTALVLGVLVVPVAALPVLGPAVRLPIVLAFVCLGPGAAFVSLVRMGDAVSSWAIAFVLSLALSGALASAMVWTGWWSAPGGFAVLAVPTTVTAALALWPAFRLRLPWSADEGHDPAPGPPAAATGRRLRLVDAGDSTDLIPLVADRADATTVLPRALNAAFIDFTRVPPRVVDLAGDATTVLPRVVDAAGDATSMLPRVGAGADATSVLPRVGVGADATTVLPRVGDDATAHFPLIVVDGVPARPPRPDSAAGRRAAVIGVGIGAAAIAAWLTSLALTSVAGLDDYGLLAAMHPTYLLALGLCVVGFLVELARQHRRGWLLLGHTAVLVLIMRATVPILWAEPEYAWTYKHIGVIELFQTYGRITDGTDIYQQWPTLFALAAHIVGGSGVGPLRLAAWGPAFFNVAFCIPMFALARTLATDPRVPYLTIFLYTGTNWVGQDYLSPQAFALTLALGTLLVVIRWLRRTATTGQRRFRLLDRVWRSVAEGLPPVPYTSKYASRAATAAMSLVFAVVVAAHQLTPYMVAVGAVALVALGLVRSYRIIPIIVGLAVGYLMPRYGVVDHYGLLQGFNFFGNARTVTGSAMVNASAGRQFNVDITLVVALVVWGLAVLAVASAWRRPGPVAVPGLLAFAPFGILLAQSYGGEAIFRVYLFSAPWCTYLIASLMLRRRWLPHVAHVPAGAAALVLAVGCTLQAGQGPAMANVFTTDDVAAAEYVYSHAERDARIVLAANNFPAGLAPNSLGYTALIDQTGRLGLYELSDAGATTLDARFNDEKTEYLVFSPCMVGYLRYYGYMSADTLTTLQGQISKSPRWQLVFHSGDAFVYRRAPGQTTTTAPGPGILTHP
jgi:hypothetical protein